MEAIVRRLQEIDETASAILDHTAEEKLRYQESMQAKTDSFDKELQEKTDAKIRAMTDEMDKKTQAQIKQLSDETTINIQKARDYCSVSKEKIAGSVFEYVTGSKWQE